MRRRILQIIISFEPSEEDVGCVLKLKLSVKEKLNSPTKIPKCLNFKYRNSNYIIVRSGWRPHTFKDPTLGVTVSPEHCDIVSCLTGLSDPGLTQSPD